MADFEELLRSEIARHRDDFTPSPDFTERIHARVAKRRRQRRAVAGAAGLALVAVVAAGALLASPSSHQTVEVADDHDSSTTTAVTPPPTGDDGPTTTTSSAEAPPSTRSPDATGDATGPGSGSPGGGEGSGSAAGGSSGGSSPQTTRSGSGSGSGSGTTTTETGDALLAPDGESPAAGTCGAFSGTVVEVVLNPDVPSPRCVEVTADQRLQVRNAAGETVTVTFGGSSVTLDDGESYLFNQPFGDYLAPGVHRVSATIYGDSGAEIWLKP